MYFDFDVAHIKTIDPKQLGSCRPYLTVTAEIDSGQATDLLVELLKSAIVDDDDIKQALKEHRAGLFGEIGDEAIAEMKQ